MPIDTIPQSGNLADGQYIQIAGPDGIITGFQYNAQQNTLYFKESQVIYPSFHGATHIAQDPVPEATCDTRGLMSSADKCKLDALVSTRLGILGFMGAGFPDDGGWMQGDIILAAGTEFISLERVGNVVRFTVDSPIPLNCSCETCAQIFWVQDETDISAVRPPTCGGKMPGVNGYGELKIYAFPETTIFDPNNPAAKLNSKAQYPALLFTRYSNSISPGMAEFDCILKRNTYNNLQTEIGWTMTPGTGAVPEMIWFMGTDANNNQMQFSLDAETTPGLLGGLLFNGNLITRRPAVITGYSATILSTNQYTLKWWDIDKAKALGDYFTATNVWMYNYPESIPTSATPQRQVMDVTIDILPVGTIVDVVFIQVGTVAGTPILHYYFNKRPEVSPANLWAEMGNIQFGDLLLAREDATPTGSSIDMSGSTSVDASRLIEPTIWGLIGVDDPFLLFSSYNTGGASTPQFNYEPRAIINTTLPGMVIQNPPTISSGYFCERPVFLWNRNEIGNTYIKLELGRPDFGAFHPIDILFNAPIDSYSIQYMRVTYMGSTQGVPGMAPGQNANYICVRGARFHDLPASGAIRVISPGNSYNAVFRYSRKCPYVNLIGVGTGTGEPPDAGLDTIALIADISNNGFAGNLNDVVELLHADYNAPCVRIELVPGSDTQNSIAMQVKVGGLDMGTPYEGDTGGTAVVEDYVRGLAPGYTISQIFTQSADFTGIGAQPSSIPQGFMVYDGGLQAGGLQLEYWNDLEIMYRNSQVWVWWNGLLITPNTQLSALLPNPVGVNTPYFPINATRRAGKVGLRLWPGHKLRSVNIRSQLKSFSEFSYGQVVLA